MNSDAQRIINEALSDAMPGSAVRKALEQIAFQKGKLILVSAGKAAWEMASAAYDVLSSKIDDGIVITKYGHAKGNLGKLEICEAGHPVPDRNTYLSTNKALTLVQNLQKDDNVLFLLSGGGSALFEKSALPQEETEDITRQLLSSGADIVKMNTIRKRLSLVKGGRFALACEPAHVFSVVLSDIIGDPLDMIASGPAYPDASTCQDAVRIAEDYHLSLSEKAWELLNTETPKKLSNVTTLVTGSVKQLIASAKKTCLELGYKPVVLSDCLSCEARDAGFMLGKLAMLNQDTNASIAFLAGGETVVHLTGKGLGGRNQEIALAAAKEIRSSVNTCVFSFGSDGTDGPTNAAGGFVDENTFGKLQSSGYDIDTVLKNNDAYHALQAANSLIITGPTGTNVNDLSVVLIKR